MSYTEIRSGYPIARKDYSCEWCAEPIEKGQKHFYRFYQFEGTTQTGRMHLECDKAYGEEDEINLENGWSPGDYKRGTTECA